MRTERAIEILENEMECVKRNDMGVCNRDCAQCDLLLDSAEILNAYQMIIDDIKNTIEDGK